MTASNAPDPTAPAPQVERRAPRWMKITLILSLAANAVVLGLVAGVVLRGGPGDGGPRMIRDGILPLTQALDPKDRREIGEDIRRTLQAQDSRGDVQWEHQKTLALLRADPFDAAAFAVHLEGQAARGMVRIKTSQEALIRHLNALSVEDRLAYADRVEAALQKRRNGPPKP